MRIRAALLAGVLAAACGCEETQPDPRAAVAGRPPREAMAAPPDSGPAAVELGDSALFAAAAETAWAYVEAQYQPRTGLVNSVWAYPYGTLWDIGSGLAALFCAAELGLLEPDEYDRRMGRALRTLGGMRLFDGAAHNKNYRTWSGEIASRSDRPDAEPGPGYGWSATDLGRLLIWLRIIALNHGAHAEAARAVVDRIDASRIVRDGYLWGESILRGRQQAYQEGRIGYEQYAATGFALWGHHAGLALDLLANTEPTTVHGVELLADRRAEYHLTSEPFVMLGLEVGWQPPVRALAWRLLEAQRRRWEESGQVTIVSEDALPDPPHYFYYYAVHHDAGAFVVGAQGTNEALEGPRWVSAKGAYAWHALLPGPYTRLAVETVAAAATDAGWASGVYEGSGRVTGSLNVNTAAVILEAALYHRIGRPLLYRHDFR